MAALVWFGYALGLSSAENNHQRSDWAETNQLQAKIREKDGKIMQLERLISFLEKEPRATEVISQDIRNIEPTGYTATYRGRPGAGGRWDIEPARYPPVSSMRRIGGGQ